MAGEINNSPVPGIPELPFVEQDSKKRKEFNSPCPKSKKSKSSSYIGETNH